MTLPYWIAPKRKPQLPYAPVTRKPVELGPEEVLSGYVQGKKASDLEERAANSHYLLGIPFTFRARISIFPIPQEQAPKESKQYWWDLYHYGEPQEVRQLIPYEMSMNLPGELEIDLLADVKGRLWPILIDGQIGHFMTTAQRDLDQMKTDAINISMAPYGAHGAVRVPFWLLRTQEQSDIFFRGLYEEI